jgi:hypothetical protein
MKKQIEDLLNLGLDLDKFYCVTLFYEIKLQGYATASLMEHLNQLGYELNFNKKNNCESNLISLCKRCHGNTQKDRDAWISYYKKKMVDTFIKSCKV